MIKEKYERTELEIINFQMQDVIMISPLEQDELPVNSGGTVKDYAQKRLQDL